MKLTIKAIPLNWAATLLAIALASVAAQSPFL